MSAQFRQMLREHYDLTPTTEETHAVPEKGYTVTTVMPARDVAPGYDVRTSTDKIAELTAQLDAVNQERAASSVRLRELSEQMSEMAEQMRHMQASR